MTNQLNIAFIQPNTVWESPKKNRKNIDKKFNELEDDIDLLILPETFTTGFSMKPKDLAESMDGKTVQWMKNLAIENNMAVTGSLIIEEDKVYYNRLLFVFPDGTIQHYDKRHLFSLAGENKAFTAGDKKLIIEYKGWKICPMVCYDLRFPAWSRNTEDYDVLIYVANWPKPRILAWDVLLKARAIENMCYCIGVNRVGQDIDLNEYSGNSAVYDVLGNAISTINTGKEHIEVVTLDKKHIKYYRDKLNFLADKDNFSLKV